MMALTFAAGSVEIPLKSWKGAGAVTCPLISSSALSGDPFPGNNLRQEKYTIRIWH